jgi:hypothetical protein
MIVISMTWKLKDSNMKKFKILIMACLLIATGSASALPITGSLGFTGSYTIAGGTSLANATGINITGNSATITGLVDGSFATAGITAGQTATYNNFTLGAPTSNLWSIGGFNFDLTKMVIDFQSSNLLALSGIGIITSTNSNLDPTLGGWTFTANSFGGSNFTFSSSAGVPEPTTAMLLGIGLLGVGALRKLRNTA